MRIAIDIDSTLHDYWEQFAGAVQRRFGVTLAYEDQVTWEIALLRPEQVRAAISETHGERHVLAAEPYPGAVETVRAWHEAGHFIHVTSHRATDCHPWTAAWLDRIALPYDELHCSFDKVTHCAEIGIELLVDDSPRNLERAIDAGMRTATLLHPWNRDLCETEDVICAEDWHELARRLEPVLA